MIKNNATTIFSLFRDRKGISTTLDALLFLVMVSISAALLMPVAMTDSQYRAAEHTSIEDMSKHLLRSLISSTVDDFEYYHYIDSTGMHHEDLGDHDELDMLFKKRYIHLKPADILAEAVIFQLKVKGHEDEDPIYVRAGGEDHLIRTEKVIDSYLHSRLGRSYNYRLEVNWYPVTGTDISSSFTIGNMNPPDAIVQKSRIALPYDFSVSYNTIASPLNDSILENTMNRTYDEQKEILYHAFIEGIKAGSMEIARKISGIKYPAPDNERKMNSIFIKHVSSPYHLDYNRNIEENNTPAIPHKEYPFNIAQNKEFEDLLCDIISSTAIHNSRKDINSTIETILEAEDIESAKLTRDRQMENIFHIFNQGGAEVILMLW
ncbi:DUF7284 family protein [Methanosalsum zhilinae]